MRKGMFALAAALVAASVPAEPAECQEKVTPIFKQEIANVPGKSLVALEVAYAPGAESAAHSHPGSAFVYAYVLTGEIASALDDEEPRIYRAGESWHERPGARHRVSRNASPTKPAKLLAIFVLDSDEGELVTAEGE